jgi:hypothetical protein
MAPTVRSGEHRSRAPSVPTGRSNPNRSHRGAPRLPDFLREGRRLGRRNPSHFHPTRRPRQWREEAQPHFLPSPARRRHDHGFHSRHPAAPEVEGRLDFLYPPENRSGYPHLRRFRFQIRLAPKEVAALLPRHRRTAIPLVRRPPMSYPIRCLPQPTTAVEQLRQNRLPKAIRPTRRDPWARRPRLKKLVEVARSRSHRCLTR